MASKAKAAAKPKPAPAKPVTKSAPAKKSASPAKAPIKPAVKPAAKPAAKAASPAPAPKAPAKAAAKPASKAPIKATVKPVNSSAPKTATKPAASAKTAPAPTKSAPAPAKPAPAPTSTSVVALRVPRGKSGPLTAPSMPPAVASTAAKSSYTLTGSPRAEAYVPPPVAAARKDPKLANNWKTKTAEQLTDPEVMAMPDSEYMNDKQMAFFRVKLVQLKRDILDNAGETTEHLREDTVIVPDPADRATIEEEHALELRTRDRERKLLKKIEQSIMRIDSGDYGYCDETGEPIGVGRLLARPTATLSLEAQQRRELKQKMFGD